MLEIAVFLLLPVSLIIYLHIDDYQRIKIDKKGVKKNGKQRN